MRKFWSHVFAVGTAACTVALSVTGSAHAASTENASGSTRVEKIGETLLVTADPNKTNNITITIDPAGNNYFVTDSGDTLSPVGACMLQPIPAPPKARCPSPVSRIEVDVKNFNDTVVIWSTISILATVNGGQGNDALVGGAADDSLNGQAGNDLILGGPGDDKLYGEDGNDNLNGQDGNDDLRGAAGVDTLNGGNGDDGLFAYGGNDVLNGGPGEDFVNGGEGDDLLIGQDGNDVLGGQQGNDTVVGGIGNDTLNGEDGNDVLFGSAGDDKLTGEAGNDTLNGEAGNDTLNGVDNVPANDTVNGGPDTDDCSADAFDTVLNCP